MGDSDNVIGSLLLLLTIVISLTKDDATEGAAD
jgi:hypothetical protein